MPARRPKFSPCQADAQFPNVHGRLAGRQSDGPGSRASRIGRARYPIGTIQLFEPKCTGSFNTHVECVAFVTGVEVVLNYMKPLKGVKSLLTHVLEMEEGKTAAEPAA